MSKAPRMPLFVDAYLADTMHLSLEEHGAYLKLLMVTWRNNGVALPDDDARMARVMGVTTTVWRRKLRPVLEPFFDLSEGTWRSKRLEKTWFFVERAAQTSRENGKRGGRPKTLKYNETENPAGIPAGIPAGNLEETQEQSLQSYNPPPPKGGVGARAHVREEGDLFGDPPTSQKPKRSPPADVDEMARIWNEALGDVVQVRTLNDNRRKRLATIYRDVLGGSMDQWRGAVERIRASDKLMGRAPGSYAIKAFDWVLRGENLLQVIEGAWDNRGQTAPSGPFYN
jgi:uncharacterized protein YdaU (DUF1376 family)